MTDDEDGLKVYGGRKLLSPTNNGGGAGPRKRTKDGDNQLLEINAGINTDSDSDVERQLRRREADGHSSDEGLVSPKKVSNDSSDFVASPAEKTATTNNFVLV